MKKALLLSVIASTMIMAGGDFVKVEEPVVVIPEPVVTDEGFYLGLAYANLGEEYSRQPSQLTPRNFDESISALMLQAGYKYNSYIAVEGRYTYGRMGEFDVENEQGDTYNLAGPNVWGLYVKPMYPVTDAFDVYALLGYAYAEQNTVKLNSIDGFSWGFGASYEFMEDVAVFVDYTSLVDTDHTFSNVTKDYTIDSTNFGVTYSF